VAIEKVMSGQTYIGTWTLPVPTLSDGAIFEIYKG
jgi:hypothetical protein